MWSLSKRCICFTNGRRFKNESRLIFNIPSKSEIYSLKTARRNVEGKKNGWESVKLAAHDFLREVLNLLCRRSVRPAYLTMPIAVQFIRYFGAEKRETFVVASRELP